MADILYSSGNDIGTFTDYDRNTGSAASLNTGDLRRKYNFGDRVSELALAQDPFFRFVSKVAKKPTDDPSFKFTERRDSWHKRYAYVMGHINNSGTASYTQGTLASASTSNTGTSVAAGETLKLYMAGDYKYEGNVQNVYGQTATDVTVGASGTTPKFFLPGQIVKIPMSTTGAGTDPSEWGVDYVLLKLTKVDEYTSTAIDSKYPTLIEGTVVKASASHGELAGFYNDNFSPSGDSAGDEVVADKSIAGRLESARSYVVGSVFDKGTGYPETWKDQPFVTQYGQTQIWKTTMAMTNTDRATSLKYESDEWARIWKEKLVEHKWDIEQSLLFGTQDSTYRTTQGAVDWILNNGNIFSLNTATKTQDDFLDDMSNLLDPRYNNSQSTVFFCSTDVYNWLHKLSGYFNNNVSIGSNFRADMVASGKKNVLGLGVTTISTVYGDMNVVRNIHLDGTNIKILGIDMKHVAYRPLVGNGLNRDTSVYVGVQTLENSGVDRRVDQILTEAGMEFSMPESHAVWKV